jgi:uncharacterized membrane protein YkgB
MPPISARAPRVGPAWKTDLETRALAAITRHAVDVLRLAIGAVFVWFGVLKVVGRSPAAALVIQTVRVFPVGHAPVVVALGVMEIAIGVGLLFSVALRTTLLLFIAQQAGTFLVLIVCPDVAFQHHNPLLLTMTGEFVVKNFVFLAAGLAVGGSSEDARRQRIVSTSSAGRAPLPEPEMITIWSGS